MLPSEYADESIFEGGHVIMLCCYAYVLLNIMINVLISVCRRGYCYCRPCGRCCCCCCCFVVATADVVDVVVVVVFALLLAAVVVVVVDVIVVVVFVALLVALLAATVVVDAAPGVDVATVDVVVVVVVLLAAPVVADAAGAVAVLGVRVVAVVPFVANQVVLPTSFKIPRVGHTTLAMTLMIIAFVLGRPYFLDKLDKAHAYGETDADETARPPPPPTHGGNRGRNTPGRRIRDATRYQLP